MYFKTISTLFAVSALCAFTNAAPAATSVSLFLPKSVPFGDNQLVPLSAHNNGVDSQGRTTWQVIMGTPTPTGTDTTVTATPTPTGGPNESVPPAFIATVVEGPGDNAHFDYRVDANRTSSGDCSIKDGVANCSFDLVVSGSQITSGSATETATFLAIVSGGSPMATIGSAGKLLVASSVIVVGAFVNTLL